MNSSTEHWFPFFDISPFFQSYSFKGFSCLMIWPAVYILKHNICSCICNTYSCLHESLLLVLPQLFGYLWKSCFCTQRVSCVLVIACVCAICSLFSEFLTNCKTLCSDRHCLIYFRNLFLLCIILLFKNFCVVEETFAAPLLRKALINRKRMTSLVTGST